VSDSFKVGDHIEVTAKPNHESFGAIRGTALDERGIAGLAAFSMLLPDDYAGKAQRLTFSLNYVDVKRLFSADVARNQKED
jgi:hypothetical protein